jgi:hypothetical protein
MKISKLTLALLCIAQGLPGIALAAEFVGRADVTRVEPMHELQTTRRCRLQRPQTDDLLELLNWDLCRGQYLETNSDYRLKGYRVFYEWDGREFSRVMAQRPRQTIAVRIRLN